MFERYQIDYDAYHQQARTGPCFICEIVERQPDYPAHFVYEDDLVVAFLDKYPPLYGYVLVTPLEHKEQVTGDFTLEAYLAVQRRVYLIAEAVRQEVEAERVYLLSLGSNQGNAHVHWHIAPLPTGVPYRAQQLAAIRQDPLRIPAPEQASFATRIRQRLEQLDG